MFEKKPKAEEQGIVFLQALLVELQGLHNKLDALDTKITTIHAAYQSINPPR